MEIVFEYSSVFDEYIAELTQSPLDQSKVALAEAFVPKLNDQWTLHGKRLLKTASRLSGFEFKLSHLKCTICVGDFVSMSHPFVVNVSRYLQANDLDVLEETIFHEALHVLLTDNWKIWPTELIRKYGGVNPEVDAHLHLMSLELATHLQLGDAERIEKVESWYRKIGGGYLDAWSLVRSKDTYREFIRELGDATQWQAERCSPEIRNESLTRQRNQPASAAPNEI